MNEPIDKPPQHIGNYIRWIGAFTILIACFMAGYTISQSTLSSEVSKLKNDVDRKEKSLEIAINQLNIVTSAFETYRKQHPGLNDGQLIEENKKLRKDLEILISQITISKEEIKDKTKQISELSKTNESLVKENNNLKALVNIKDKEIDNIKQKLDQAILESKKLEDKLKKSVGIGTKKRKVNKKVPSEDEYICDACGEIHKKQPFISGPP